MVAATVVLTMTSTVLISCVDNIDNLASQQETNLDDQTDYTLKQVSVNRNGQSAGIVTIRFLLSVLVIRRLVADRRQ
jgi:hypothetical protein